MDHSSQKQNVNFIKHIDIYFVVFLNFLLVLGMIIGKNQFLHSTFISIGLVINIAMLISMVISQTLFQKRMAKENIYITITALLETTLLFILPLLILKLPPSNLLLIETIVITTIQSFAIVLFWKVFKNELKQPLVFLRLKFSTQYLYKYKN